MKRLNLLFIFGAIYFMPLSMSASTQKIEKETTDSIVINTNKKNHSKLDAVTGASPKNILSNIGSKFELSGYGTINYHKYTQFDTDKYQTDKFDCERLTLYANYIINKSMKIKSEIEFEHGGTGATMEFDSQEEAGEFEIEIEKGGEVKLERLYFEWLLHPMANLRIGRFKLHIGSAQTLDRPIQYFTVKRQEMEDAILPIGWYENGVQMFGSFFDKKLDYELSVSTGLDATGFSSRNWIKNGYQTRFEMPVAESFAVSGRLDYRFSQYKDDFVGLSAYWNNTTKNRPKKDMYNIPGNLFITEAHFSMNRPSWRFNTVLLWGYLQNSEYISKKNSSLSNNLQVKRTPVGREALGFSAEAGYDILHFFDNPLKQKMFGFLRYDFYDTMFQTEGVIIKKPRWCRNTITAGINYFVNKNVVLKAEYQTRILGSNAVNAERTKELDKRAQENSVNIGLGFSF